LVPGRSKPHNIRIREDRLAKLDTTKMEVAIWLMAKAEQGKKQGTDEQP
jgi:hypothetical protein